MASPSKKPRDGTVEKIGFLHNVSPITTSVSGKCKYFTSQMQHAKDEFQRIISFNCGQHQTFKEAARLKSPVKISNCDLTPSFTDESVLNLRFTTRSSLQFNEPPEFVCRPPLDTEVQDIPTKSCTISELVELTSSQKGNISGKVISTIIEEEEVQTKFGARKMKKVLLGDLTGTTPCCVWEGQREQLKDGKTYRITNLVMHQYQGSTYASTSIGSSIQLADDIEVDNADNIENVCSNVQSAEVTTLLKCPTCRSKATVIPGQKTVKCSTCKKRSLSDMIITEIKCLLTIAVGKGTMEVNMPSTHLKPLLKSLDCLSENSDTIEETLLLSPPLYFQLHGNDVTKVSKERLEEENPDDVLEEENTDDVDLFRQLSCQ